MENTANEKTKPPIVHKKWLYILSGLVWSGVGILLLRWVYVWLRMYEIKIVISVFAISIIPLFLMYRLIFIKVVRKNIVRLHKMPQYLNLFLFQEVKSYLIAAFMIALGISLRSSPLPRNWLAIVYLIIGGSLFLASFEYYTHIYRTEIKKIEQIPF